MMAVMGLGLAVVVLTVKSTPCTLAKSSGSLKVTSMRRSASAAAKG